jgi:hypothetical protein
MDDAADSAVSVNEQHVERDIGVAHPHRDRLRVAEIEQHTAIVGQAFPEHEPIGPLIWSGGQLDLETEPSGRALDREPIVVEARRAVGGREGERQRSDCDHAKERP